MLNQDIIAEQQHLDVVKTAIDNYRQVLFGHVNDIEENYKNIFIKIRDPQLTTDERFWAVFNAIENYKHSGISGFSKHLLELTEIQDTPYFARVDFNQEPLYIGKFAFYENASKTLVTDWRAPAATLYYNYSKPTKNATYSVDLGDGAVSQFTGELNLKRNIEIQSGQVVSIFDNDSDKLSYLKEKLSHQKGGLLKDIVTTIQEDQNQIIRLPLNARVIVQGSVGSGKTTIAVHRLSYLFYNYPGKMSKDSTLIITPSAVLLNYIARTLPSIGIYETTCLTFYELLKKLFRANGLKYRIVAKGSQPPNLGELNDEIIKFKRDTLRKLAKNQLCFRYGLIKEYRRLEDLGLPPVYIVLSLKKQLNKDLAKLKHLAQVEVVEDNIRELKISYVAIKDLQEKLEILVQEIRGELLGQFSSNLNIDEASQLLYLYDQIVGLKKPQKFQQIIIDEAQDLSESNYLVIKAMAGRSGLTILGDLNQQTKLGAVKSWEALKEVLGDIDIVKLKISYRSTKEITDFSAKILAPYVPKEALPQSFERRGQPVEIKSTDTWEDLLTSLVGTIKDVKKNRQSSIGVIISSPKDRLKILNFLKGRLDNVIEVTNDFRLFSDSAIYVCRKELVKGLEFETVLLINPDEESFPKTLTGAKELYVCTSRAINELHIYNLRNQSKS
ncbi:MAG: AAA family ATPase [candidate division WWE3 bacterium]|nr:AAA family ATPase [candidate division WWE3 bacterium]